MNVSSTVYNKKVSICYSHHHYLVLPASHMATQTDILSDLTDDNKAAVFQVLDGWLNSAIFYALLYGEHGCLVS